MLRFSFYLFHFNFFHYICCKSILSNVSSIKLFFIFAVKKRIVRPFREITH